MKWAWPLIIGGLIMTIFLGRKIVAPYIENMAKAIMDFEKWDYGSVSERNNNPGNIKAVPGTIFEVGKSGVIGSDPGGHAIFDNFESGWNGLITQLKLAFLNKSAVYKSSDTLYDFFGKYAEANSKPYAEFVARQLGVSPYATLNSISFLV